MRQLPEELVHCRVVVVMAGVDELAESHSFVDLIVGSRPCAQRHHPHSDGDSGRCQQDVVALVDIVTEASVEVKAETGIDDVEALEARATVEKPQKSGPANLGVRGFGKDVNVWGWRGYLVYLISFTLTYHKGVIQNDSESTLVQHILYW